ncbi:MAG: glutamate--tRNA ligase [Bacteroidota bacterium]|nr:glutamate--tRNA ligase [Bacteroidota bacterium]
MTPETSVRVRFAPSPTGFLHIGGLRTALYNYLFARRHHGVFVLRIEDTDRNRFVEGAAEKLLETLHWAGLSWDEGPDIGGPYGPYVQSERLALYRQHAESLLREGKAYRCFCSPEELDRQRRKQAEEKRPPMYDRRCRTLSRETSDARAKAGEPFTIRFRVPLTGETVFHDAVRGEIRISHAVIDDQVLLKSDGYPTYHLANVVDDHAMRISDVIRGEEWLPSTVKHTLLYEAFGWPPPRFAHLPLLLNPDRSKLSKRQGDVAVEEYRAQGFLPEALINFVALLGWSSPDEREILSMDELAALFSLDRVGKAGAIFDIEKLRWFNGRYFRALPLEERVRLCIPHLERAGYDTRDPIRTARIVDALSNHLVLPADIVEEAAIFFRAPALPASATEVPPFSQGQEKAVLRAFLTGVRTVVPWERGQIKKLLERIQGELGVRGKELYLPIRIALTGKSHGPELPVVAELLGPEECSRRLEPFTVG